MADQPSCPRCSGVLETGRFGDVEMHMCDGCLGVLVAQRNLVPLLGELTKRLSEEVDLDHAITPLADHPGDAHCPQCSKMMDTFGYMGTNLVYADRCGTCWLVWTDPEELSVMAVLHARTNRRVDTRQADRDKWQEGLNNRVSRMLLNRARSNRIGTSLF